MTLALSWEVVSIQAASEDIMNSGLLARQYFDRSAIRFRGWPRLLLVMLLAFGCKSALAQSSAGSLRCGAPSGSSSASGAAATAAAKKNKAKVDEFNAMQKQEQENQQAIQKAGDDILNGLKGSGESDIQNDANRSDNSDMDPNSPAEEVAPNANYPSAEPSATPSSGSAAAVNALLDTDTPSSNSAAAVNSLLDDQTDEGASTNSVAAVNALLREQPDAGAPGGGPGPAFSAEIPQNPNFAAAMQNSQDTPPSPAVLTALEQETDVANPSSSVMANIQDGLQGLVSTVRSDAASVKATLGTLMDTPTGQMVTGGTLTTVPAPESSDTPEQMSEKVFSQAIMGFGFFSTNTPAKALYKYMSSNLNQFMAQVNLSLVQLGLAPTTPAPSNDPGQQ